MKIPITALVLALVALAGCKPTPAQKAADALDAEQEAARPKVTPTGSGLAPGVYELRIATATAEDRAPRGEYWDLPPETEPDLRITAKLDDHPLGSCNVKRDRITGSCKLYLPIAIEATTKLSLYVEDRDTLHDQVVGEATLEDPSHWALDLELPMNTTKRLKSASVMLDRYHDPFTYRLYGTLVAIVLVGITLVLGRRRLLVPHHEDHVEPPLADPASAPDGVPMMVVAQPATKRAAITEIPLFVLALSCGFAGAITAFLTRIEVLVPHLGHAGEMVFGVGSIAFVAARIWVARKLELRAIPIVLLVGVMFAFELVPTYVVYVLVGALVLGALI